MANQKKNIARIYGKYSIITINITMVFLLLVGMLALYKTSIDPVEQIAPIADPLTSAIVLIIAIPIFTIFMVFLSKFDRRCAEDYTFQLMANAALVTVTTVLFFTLITRFDALNDLTGLRILQGDDFMAIIMVSWSAAYFIFQRRGLK